MNFEATSNFLDKISSDCIVVFAFEGKEGIGKTRSLSDLDKALSGLISDTIKLENFKAKSGNILTIYPIKKTLAPKIFVLGLGKKEEFNANELRRCMALFAKSIKKKIASVALSVLDQSSTNLDLTLQSQMIIEGLLLGNYSFNKYQKKEKDNEKELELIVFSQSNKNSQLKIKTGVKWAEIYYNATKLARDLVNEPASVISPTFLAKVAQDLAKNKKDIKCIIYERPDLEKMGMNAFLGVAQGSDTPPKFIYLEYIPSPKQNNKRKIAIVGKGITFDSGGVSIKPADSMQTMKMDMAGAAAVLGLFSVISKIKPNVSVMGLIAATPNLISGKSLVPGDILRAMNGKTIEVLNTDAEGRVTMADSLSFAVKKGALEIIDLATLTGACMVALGTDISALFSNNKKLKEALRNASESAGEKLWELPLVKEYKELNKSEVADIANIPNTRYGGAITGALFLQEFVDNKPWVHLDIAGTAFSEKGHDLGPKGGTGFGVRTLINFLKEL